MKNKKLKLFLKIFFLLVLVQLIVIIAELTLGDLNGVMASIISVLLTIISFPLSIISAKLPFYSGEGIPITMLFWLLNLTIQTLIIYGVFRIIKRIR